MDRYYLIGSPLVVSYKYGQTHNEFPAANLEKSFCEEGWSSLTEVCFWSYWTRLWVIQELVLAQDIMIQSGDLQLSWAALADAISIAPHHAIYEFDWKSQLMRLPFWRINHQRSESKSQMKEPSTLFELFRLHNGSHCTDSRDKIIGLRELSRVCCRDAFVADYRHTHSEHFELLLRHFYRFHKISDVKDITPSRSPHGSLTGP